MSDKKDFKNGCFCPNWLEVDLNDIRRIQTVQAENPEVKLSDYLRKDSETLMKELQEIRQNIENIAQKEERLARLLHFYNTGELA